MTGLQWGPSADVFSFGCVVLEMIRGENAFPCTLGPLERLEVIQRLIGPIPRSMIIRSWLAHSPYLRVVGEDVTIVAGRRDVKAMARYRMIRALKHLQVSASGVHDAI